MNHSPISYFVSGAVWRDEPCELF